MFQNLKKIVQNPYTFSILSKVFGVLVGLLFTIFQARYLGAEIKGQVAMVNSIVSITSIVFGFGIYYAYPYFKRNTEVDIMPIFMKIALLMLVLYSFIAILIIIVMKLPSKHIAILILTPLLAYDGIVSYITLIEVPNRRSAIDMAVVLLELVVLILLWITSSPSFVIGVFVITIKDVTKACLFTWWWKDRIFIPTESIWIWLPKLIKFGFFPMLSLLMTTLNYRIDVLMLNGKVTDAAIGIYSVGVLLAERIWMIPDAMKGVMVSKISKGKDAQETAFAIRICNSACLIIVIGIIIFGKPFLDLAFGREYTGAYQVTMILLVGVFAMIYYKLIASYNIAMGKQNISFMLLGLGVISNVISNTILIPIMGIYGAGVASVISYTLCAALFILYFCKVTKISLKSMVFINKDDYQNLKQIFLKKRH